MRITDSKLERLHTGCFVFHLPFRRNCVSSCYTTTSKSTSNTFTLQKSIDDGVLGPPFAGGKLSAGFVSAWQMSTEDEAEEYSR